MVALLRGEGKRLALGAGVLLAGAWLLTCGLGLVRKGLWFDELFTYYVAALDSPGRILGNLRAGMDNHPPLFYLLSHASMRLFGQNAIACRLPAALGLGLALASVYAFVRRRTGPLPGVVAALLLFFSPLVPYGFEARGYGLVCGLGMFTLCLWQRLTDPGRGRLGPVWLFLALSATLWSHYYAVLVFVPLGLGELVRTVERRRIDGAVWGAFAAGALNLYPMLRFVGAANQGFSTHFWATPGSPLSIGRAYDELFQSWLLPVGATVTVLAALWLARLPHSRVPGEAAAHALRPRPVIPRADLAAALGLLFCPAVMWVGARLVTNAFLYRYVLFTVFGGCILGAFALASLPLRSAGAAVALVLAGLLPIGVKRHLNEIQPVAATTRYNDWAAGLVQRHGVLAVIDSPLEYLRSHHYADPWLRAHLVHLNDFAATLRFNDDDTIPRAFVGLQKYHDVGVVDLTPFLARRSSFLLLSRPGFVSSWILPRLLEEPGLQIRLVAREHDRVAYLVTPTGATTAAR